MASEENPRDRFIELVEEGVLDPVTAATMSAKWLSRDEMTQLLDTYEINEEGREPRDLFIQLVEDGMLDGVQATIMTAKWMGTDDVQEMLRVNELLDDHEDNGNGDSAPTASPGRPEADDEEERRQAMYRVGRGDPTGTPSEGKINLDDHASEIYHDLQEYASDKGFEWDELDDYDRADRMAELVDLYGAEVLTMGETGWGGFLSPLIEKHKGIHSGDNKVWPAVEELMIDILDDPTGRWQKLDERRQAMYEKLGPLVKRMEDEKKVVPLSLVNVNAQLFPGNKYLSESVIQKAEEMFVQYGGGDPTAKPSVPRSVPSDGEGKRFLFWDGLSSFTMSDGEILNLGTEDDEPELYEFARNAKMGDVMFSENFGGPDVERVPADYRYGDERFSDADRILAGEIRAWAKTHPNEKQAEKFADDLLRRGEKRAVTEILLESEGMQIEEIMNSILHDYKDKDRAWAKEQFLRAWNNTDAELLPTGDYPGAVVREILQHQFDIGSGWNSDDIRTRNLIHGLLENQGKYGGYEDFPKETFQKIWDMATKSAPRMDAEGRGYDITKEAIKEGVVQWVADEIDDNNGFPALKHMKYDANNPDWGHVHGLVRRALERYREDNPPPTPKETAKDDSPMAERIRVADKMNTVIEDAMLDIQDEWGGRQGEMDGPTMESKLRELLAKAYTTGADTNVFPHEEIAEAIGESPQAVDGYFADDFNIDVWHQETPKEGPVFSEAPEPSMYWNPKHNVWVADLASSQLIHPFTEEFGSEGAVQEISHIEHEGPPKVDGLKVLYESYPDGTHITGELRFDHDENSWVIRTTGEWADYFRQQGMSDHYNLEGGWPVHSYDMSEAKSPRDFDRNWKPEDKKGDSQGQDKNYPHHDAEFHYKGDAYIVVGFDPDKKENIVKNRGTEKTFKLKPDQITTLITAESKIDLQAFGEEKPRRSRPPVLRTGKKGGKLKSVGLKKIKAPRVGKVKSYMDSVTGRKFTRRAKGGMPKSKRFTRA